MPIAVAAADLDGDGRYDAATANNDPSANNVSVLYNCARDQGCDHFARKICQGVPREGLPCGGDDDCNGVPGACIQGPPGTTALRGDGNADGLRSAADLVAVSAEVMDDDGFQVEAIGQGDFTASPGADGNGDGRVDAQDRPAVAHRIFAGA
jgi:hypothetical protein